MDKSTLEEYIALLREMADLERRIKRTEAKIADLESAVVADSVEGTRPDGTYGPIKIRGIQVPAYDRELQRLRQQRVRYEILRLEIAAQIYEVDMYISSIPDTTVRTILRMRYLDGRTWEQISRRFGKGREWSRNKIDRFFQKKLA